MNLGTEYESSDRMASARATLSRALASESRNALARVELAASELERSGLAPALAARVDTIRAAVAEIDGLLGKMDLVSEASRVPDRAEADLAVVARSVVTRLAPSLSARDIEIRWAEVAETDPVAVAAPAFVVEGLVLGLIRLVVGAIDRSVGTDDASASVTLEAVCRGEDVCLVARSDAIGASSRFERSTRLELEVSLVDWCGAFLVAETDTSVEVGFALPANAPGLGRRFEDQVGAP